MTIPIDPTYDSPTIDAEGLTPEEEIADIELPKGKKFTQGNHPLDKNPKAQRHLRQGLGWWNYERAKQYANRSERMKAHDYIDSKQWSDEDEAELRERGQYPYVYNLMKATHDWLCGTESRLRVDYQVLPQHKEHGPDAEAKTKLLKYINNINYSRHNRSLSFKDQSISGLGWREVGIRTDETKDPLFCRYEDWRNVWHDSCGKSWIGEDWRYVFRSRIVDYDIATAMFPDRNDVLRAYVNSNSDVLFDEYDDADIDPELAELAGENESISNLGVTRNRIRLIGCEYRIPEKVKVIRGKELGSLNNTILDESNEAMRKLAEEDFVSVIDARRMVMYHMIFCGHYLLQWGRRPYDHDRFSLVPQWCYRTKRDGMPYGVAKQQIDPQTDMNKRRAKAMWHLSSNQMLIEEGNWEDFDDLVAEKDRPDGVMIVKDVSKVQLRDYAKSAITAEHVQLMDQDARFIEAVGGVNDESRGVQTNAASGKAIRARQEQTNINTTMIFENALMAFQLEGEIQLSLAEQYYTEERTIRIVGDDGRPEYVDFNKQDPALGATLNDITATQCDFTIDGQSYAATVRQSMFEQLGQMIGNLPPEIAMSIIDIWFELSDLPGRDAIVKRIRKITGQADPHEDPEDPEVKARMQAEAEEAQRQKDLNDMMIKLEMQLKQAQAEKEAALADNAIADARSTLASINQRMEEIRIKKAATLNTIEARRHQEALPPQQNRKQLK